MSTSNHIQLDPGCLRGKTLKRITLFLFYLLPSKIVNIFVSLSIISMIMEIRKENIQGNQTLLNKLSEVLKVHLNDHMLRLPEQTLSWYWGAELFDSRVMVHGEYKTLREIIADKDEFMKHKNTVLNTMLDSLPFSMQRKLGLSSPEARLSIKHNIVNTFIHG